MLNLAEMKKWIRIMLFKLKLHQYHRFHKVQHLMAIQIIGMCIMNIMTVIFCIKVI